MIDPIQKACEKAGGQTALANSISELTGTVVTQQRIRNWLARGDRVPAEYCVAIEYATNAEVTRRDLRPDDWHLIWPDLAESISLSSSFSVQSVCHSVTVNDKDFLP